MGCIRILSTLFALLLANPSFSAMMQDNAISHDCNDYATLQWNGYDNESQAFLNTKTRILPPCPYPSIPPKTSIRNNLNIKIQYSDIRYVFIVNKLQMFCIYRE